MLTPREAVLDLDNRMLAKRRQGTQEAIAKATITDRKREPAINHLKEQYHDER